MCSEILSYITFPSFGLKTDEEETWKNFLINFQQSFPFPWASIGTGLRCTPGNHWINMLKSAQSF